MSKVVDAEYLKEFLEAIKCFGLEVVPGPVTTRIVSDWYQSAEPSILAATVVAAHQISQDYLSDPDRMVRAAETAELVLRYLKARYDAGEIDRAQWTTGCSIVAPFLNWGPEASNIADEAVATFGEQPIAVCNRMKSRGQEEAERIIEESYNNYLKRRTKTSGILEIFFRKR
ncbi:MAG: hypothetical protein ACLFU0_04025 [Alphaproteobacteria bacterium]